MKTIKLLVSHRGHLLEKYGSEGLASIDSAISALLAKDRQREIDTAAVWLDDAASLRPYGAAPVGATPSPDECKSTIDVLFRSLSPDYLAILGAGDVVPYFQAPNPSFQSGGDDDTKVPTDNPYACSRPFSADDRESYLIPDRVIGRIPDLPGKNEVEWLTSGLATAASWKLATAKDYGPDLLLCCQQWRGAGTGCVEFLSRSARRLMISPPIGDAASTLRKRHGARFHMIKCHGAPLDAHFYGQSGDEYPEALLSTSLLTRVTRGTVVGAMCCYGSALFDPTDPAARTPGAPPIPSAYLRQGAYGFVGSTTIAWVGIDSMQCADWIVASFLKGVMHGASLGRALLDAKQSLMTRIGQQGRAPDLAEEKTMLQFHLLGDPSIHVVPPVEPGIVAAAMLPGPRAIAAPELGPAVERRARRAFGFEVGEQLRARLPERSTTGPLPGGDVDRVFADLSTRLPGFQFGAPLVSRVVSPVRQPELAVAGARTAAAVMRASPVQVRNETFQCYWIGRKRSRTPVIDARMIKVETDREGTIVRTQVLVST